MEGLRSTTRTYVMHATEIRVDSRFGRIKEHRFVHTARLRWNGAGFVEECLRVRHRQQSGTGQDVPQTPASQTAGASLPR